MVEAKTPESAIITSFLLRPADGGRVMRHRPGQYLTFWLDIPGHHPLKRNYSISSAPGDETYRISVKREPGGVVSNWLHDEAGPGTVLKAAPPAGEFVLPERPERPVVLLSGGVGLTPMVSMLETIAERHPELPTRFVHGTLNGATHAMRARVKALAERAPGIAADIFYAEPRPEDRAGLDYDRPGLITPDWLRRRRRWRAPTTTCAGRSPSCGASWAGWPGPACRRGGSTTSSSARRTSCWWRRRAAGCPRWRRRHRGRVLSRSQAAKPSSGSSPAARSIMATTHSASPAVSSRALSSRKVSTAT